MAAAGTLALALSACVSRMPPQTAANSPASHAATPSPASAGSGSSAALASPAQSASLTSPAENGAPKTIMGLSPDQLQHLFGQPQLVRDETGAEVWQYRTAACVLDLYLYPQQAQGLRVTYLEARDRSAASFATEPCVTAVIAQRHELPTS